MGPPHQHSPPRPSRLQVLLFLQEEKEEIAAETQVTLVVAPRTLPLPRCGRGQDTRDLGLPTAPTRVTPFT